MSACAVNDTSAGKGDGGGAVNNNPAPTNAVVAGPTIEVSPVEQGDGNFRVATSERLTFVVNAPGANGVKLLYRPVMSDEQVAELKSFDAAAGAAGGRFQTEINMPADFNGEVWAQTSYPDGGNKKTETILLASQYAVNAEQANAGNSNNQGTGNDPNANESERSDFVTGGRIERASLVEGQPDVRITVNVPAFMLTLWQNGKEVKTYHVGVGRREYPIPAGMRKASQIIINPDWIPPDSEWVQESPNVKPGEKISASDPRNPLGKVKIPLGNAYLIHQAAKPTDLGNLVSHGCVRMLTSDLLDLTKKVAQARKLSVTTREIDRVSKTKERRSLNLETPMPVDINYDTIVVEGGVLYIYPDVYNQNTNTVEKLRAELERSGVDVSKLDEGTLRRMFEGLTHGKRFAVNITDINAGRIFEAGKVEPIIPTIGKGKPNKTTKRTTGKAVAHR